MIKSKLSESEVTQVISFASSGDMGGLVKYLNSLLYERGLGTDCCARPMALREEKDTDDPCFAQGYIEKILDYLRQSEARMSDAQAIQNTKKYILSLQQEIARFFERRTK